MVEEVAEEIIGRALCCYHGQGRRGITEGHGHGSRATQWQLMMNLVRARAKSMGSLADAFPSQNAGPASLPRDKWNNRKEKLSAVS